MCTFKYLIKNKFKNLFYFYSRLVLPLSVDEYQIGQLWSVAEASKQETGGGEGVEVLENRTFEGVDLYGGQYTNGQFTHKIYHVQS